MDGYWTAAGRESPTFWQVPLLLWRVSWPVNCHASSGPASKSSQSRDWRRRCSSLLSFLPVNIVCVVVDFLPSSSFQTHTHTHTHTHTLSLSLSLSKLICVRWKLFLKKEWFRLLIWWIVLRRHTITVIRVILYSQNMIICCWKS